MLKNEKPVLKLPIFKGVVGVNKARVGENCLYFLEFY
jgi:hypothetical protein